MYCRKRILVECGLINNRQRLLSKAAQDGGGLGGEGLHCVPSEWQENGMEGTTNANLMVNLVKPVKNST